MVEIRPTEVRSPGQYASQLFEDPESGTDKGMRLLHDRPEIAVGMGCFTAMLGWRTYSYFFRRKESTQMFLLKSRVMIQAMFVTPLVFVAGYNVGVYVYAKATGQDHKKILKEGLFKLHQGPR